MEKSSNNAPVSYRDLLPAILFSVALALYATRLGVPDTYVFDEVYHAYTAGQYAKANPDAFVWYHPPQGKFAYTWNHPPLGLLLMTGGVLLWGDVPFGWRFSSALFGAAGVVVIYLLGRAMTGRRRVGLLAALFLMVDGLYFTQSRIGMLDIFGTVFMLCALWALFDYLTAPPEKVRRPLLLLGTCLGLALATKWNAAYGATLAGLVVLGRGAMPGLAARRSAGAFFADPGVRRHLIWVPVSLIVLPAAVYLAAYTPFFLTGHDLAQFVELQKQIFMYHTRLEASHSYQSSWWQWPLVLRPVWYHVTYLGERVAELYTNGNPTLYWAFFPALAWVAVSWWRRRRAALGVVLLGFFGQWLPWALVPRIAFMYHFLPAATFGCLAVAVLVADLIDRRRAWRIVGLVYVACVVATFVFFYPIWAAVPLSRDAFALRIWFDSWR